MPKCESLRSEVWLEELLSSMTKVVVSKRQIGRVLLEAEKYRADYEVEVSRVSVKNGLESYFSVTPSRGFSVTSPTSSITSSRGFRSLKGFHTRRP